MEAHLKYGDFCLDPGFPFHIAYSAFGGDSWEKHSHEFGELVVVRNGHGTHVVGTREYPLEVGDVFYVEPDQAHGYSDLEGLILCNVIFDPKLFLDTCPELQQLPGYHALFHVEPLLRDNHKFTGKLHLTRGQSAYVFNMVESMKNEYDVQMPAYESVIRGYLILLVTYLARYYVVQEAVASHEVSNLSRVILYLEANYAEPISLDEIVAQACMSKSTLMRLFHKCYNVSPLAYVRRCRLTKARELLDRGEQSITQIAFNVGFSDSNYFGRLFRKEYGLSPRDYRRERARQ